ncbi:hypothetical protein OG936_21385 [Streptomyces sp. NBC_00846]|uniref:hypothetical protein n=1 Tax=Streptomyces sp. NBC_00846 TaxID=2975849 RepID=UPI00386AC3D2|nr:hypothetical protein OG936_21385 [Streptomyces sp. NBC_00846]
MLGGGGAVGVVLDEIAGDLLLVLEGVVVDLRVEDRAPAVLDQAGAVVAADVVAGDGADGLGAAVRADQQEAALVVVAVVRPAAAVRAASVAAVARCLTIPPYEQSGTGRVGIAGILDSD